MRQQLIKMLFLMGLLCLHIGLSLAPKEGNFGILKACISNHNLRLECLYAPCVGSPPYYCTFYNASFLPLVSTENCKLTLPNHKIQFLNTTTNYFCNLTRKQRVETKNITINYSIKRGKKHIKPCKDSAGLPWCLTSRWPLLIQLWYILATGN